MWSAINYSQKMRHCSVTCMHAARYCMPDGGLSSMAAGIVITSQKLSDTYAESV